MHVIGTAGHVDHGKSTLVLALTGINPDRLREEQERQMTIDLGFAWMTLPGGEEVGIVDVPGHRDFIENMLAGVGGIDAALLVIAADEGVMPQTREHLAILDLLEVRLGVVALTKVDAVQDLEWRALVRADVSELLKPTALASAPIVEVSSVTGEGLDALRAALARVLTPVAPRADRGRPRLPIDRVFTISGFGTVVTGTLAEGSLVQGQEVEILPPGLSARVRGLQTHKARVERALPGSRVAANLSGVEVRDLERGDVAASPRSYSATRLLDVQFRLLGDAEGPLRHNQSVKLFLGTAQRTARVRLLGADHLAPGEQGWLQLVLSRPLVAARHDRYILRRPSPSATLGGGQVADPQPQRLHRRRDAQVMRRLEQLAAGTPGEVLAQSIGALGPVPLRVAVHASGLDEAAAAQAIAELSASGGIRVLGQGALSPGSEAVVVSPGVWLSLVSRMAEGLEAYHRANPLRMGMPREELKSRLGLEARAFAAALTAAAEEGMTVDRGGRVWLTGHEPRLDDRQQEAVARLLARFRAAPYNPPSVKECQEAVGEEVLGYLRESGRLIQVSSEVLFDSEVYDAMVATLRERTREAGTISVAQVRDLFDTSRKYALALMEHLDAVGITVREGDVRRLVKG